MTFLVDAQLPKRLCAIFGAVGHESTHTLDLPDANRIPDHDLCVIVDSGGHILVTKDGDFVVSRLTLGTPRRLLLISAGNISNADLVPLIETFLPGLESAFQSSSFVELTRSFLIVHD